MNQLPDRHAGYNKRRLFLLSVIALTTTGIGFSIRGNIASELQADLFDPIDKLHSAEMVATALGVVFLGYAFTIAIGSPLLDFIGMGRLLRVSAICFLRRNRDCALLEKAAGAQSLFSLYRVVWLGMLIIGIGQGLVETVINPLAATLYPDDKTHKLNVLHAWWPGGIIIGGLLGLALGQMKFNWQVQMALVLLPAAIFGIMAAGSKFPPTERVAAGVSAGECSRKCCARSSSYGSSACS